MDDFAHKETERILAELERKIKALYADANRDMKKKAEVYFAQFAERDKKQKAAMEAGKITEEQYLQWRLAQIGRGERFEKLRDELADRMTDANKVAAAYINDQTPGIYSLNHNYEAYTIEKVAGNVGFTIYDEQTVRRLIQEDPNLLPKRRVNAPKDKKWNRTRFSSEITSGILQGESIGKLANRVQNLSDANRAGAIRNARTAVTGAQNAGRQETHKRAEEMGIELENEWLATLDNRTRHSHRRLDGERVKVGQKFSNGCRFPGDPEGKPAEVWNCRCTMIGVIAEINGVAAKRRDKYGLLPDMTYSQWERQKRGEGYLQE